MSDAINQASRAQKTDARLAYELKQGYIPAWLVAGPVKMTIEDLGRFETRRALIEPQLGQGVHEDTVRGEIARAYAQDAAAALATLTGLPVEGESWAFDDPFAGPQSLTWQVVRGGDDHFVNLSLFAPEWCVLYAWAYTRLVAPAATDVAMTLTTNGPASVWINGKHHHRQDHHALQRPRSCCFEATLDAGENDLLIRYELVAARAAPYLMALRVDGDKRALAPDWRVVLPTMYTPVTRRMRLESVFDQAYVKQSVYHGDDKLELHWPDKQAGRGATGTEGNGEQPVEMPARPVEVNVRVQRTDGRIYAEGKLHVGPGTVAALGKAYQFPEGDYHIVLMPPVQEFYERGMRVTRQIPVRISNATYAESSDQAPPTLEERRRELLLHAARHTGNLYAEIARMELGEWDKVRPETIQKALDKISRREDCADFVLIGLLGAGLRYRKHPACSELLDVPLRECALGFKYWMDEPGHDAMCYWTENHQILFHTCQVLAGQLFPDAQFSNTGQSGRWHRAMGEQRAFAWLRKRATGGFLEWDSNCYFSEDVLALSHLADLAEDTELADLAAVVLDKLLFTLGVNSYQGIFGSTHGRTYTSLLLDGRADRTSGISRLLWGEGALNSHILGPVGLACTGTYELPDIIAAIAQDRADEVWNRERHGGRREGWCDGVDEASEVNKVTYKTPDYMLASAQDYRPGEQGLQQHIWQATLGPDAVVFVNHPICVDEGNELRPNFWVGNGVLPRVAQWKDSLICLYALPGDAILPWTHAYFPVASFDEYAIRDGWAFARKGDGYLALTAANGLELTQQGMWAYRELRSPGLRASTHRGANLNAIWLCQMGRAARDGSFNDFVAAHLATAPIFALDQDGDAPGQDNGHSHSHTSHRVEWKTVRGDKLTFGWLEPFMRNDSPQPITGFPHYDSPYCTAELPAQEMIIRFGDVQMRLDFNTEE